MSTEHQQYSPENQLDIIRQYAATHNMEIVREYSDHGRSGLNIAGREGLNRLMADVEAKRTNFTSLLVYDVSRWGRFQDVDESAYYEYVLKRSGIRVHYCAEQFENDGSMSSSVLKTLKHSMAAEYSRELSVKVFYGQCRLIELGFRQGGAAGYGLRRQLIDRNQAPKGLLGRGERKSLQTDRVILVPGPQKEIEVASRSTHGLSRTSRLNAKSPSSSKAPAFSEKTVARGRGRPSIRCSPTPSTSAPTSTIAARSS
jgi:DNA invertase Pin-like site-specific DNA recombinase